MNYKKLCIILSIISFALPSPINNDEDSSNESLTEEEILGENSVVEISNDEISFNEEATEISDFTEVPDITEDPSNKDICDTPECQDKAKNILDILNPEVEPCDDFYEFACGNWVKNTEMSNGSYFIGTIDSINIENKNIIIKSIEEGYKVNENLTPEDHEYDKKNFEKVADLYNSCMDIETINAKGIQPMLDFFTKMEIDENRTKYNNVEDLTNLLAKLDNYDLDILFETRVRYNIKNPKINSLYIGQIPSGLLPKGYYEDPFIIYIFKEIMKSMFTKIYQDDKERNIDKIVESVYEFHKKLINIIYTDDEGNLLYLSKDYYFTMTIPYHVNTNIKSLNELYPFIDWKSYFNKRFEDLGIENPLDENTVIINTNPEYFEKLNTLIKETDSETIAAFAELKFIFPANFEYMSDDVKEIFNYYYILQYGVSSYKDIPRESTCTELFYKYLTMSASKLFVEKSFESGSKKIAENMTENIRESFIKRISEIDWLDETTRKNAIRKASSLTSHIAYPDIMMNPKEIYKYYENLEIKKDEFLNNIINNKFFRIAKEFSNLRNEYTLNEWSLPQFEWNAYYYQTNEYVLLSGFLQKPSFSPSYPSYLNYGSVAMNIGHEFTHALDDKGKLYDYDGSYNNWWSNSTQQKYDELSQCFIDQYSEYYFTDSKGEKHYLNGKNNLGENIADNGGISRGYEAWKLSLQKDPKAKENNKRLPGLTKYTPEQLYFISYAQNWCAKMSEEFEINFIKTDEHSPNNFRVLGTISNNEYFAKAFNCKINSPMNPENKCKIW